MNLKFLSYSVIVKIEIKYDVDAYETIWEVLINFAAAFFAVFV